MSDTEQKLDTWITTRRFLWIAAVFLGVGVIIGTVILTGRKKTSPMRAECGQLVWPVSALPVSIWLDPIAAEWEPDVRAGIGIIDPEGRWLHYAGQTGPAGNAPSIQSILVSTANIDDHGNTHADYDKRDCKITHVTIQLPGLILPGKARTRATAHELGHALGLAHSDWETDVQYPHATSLFSFALSKEDRAILCASYGCP